MNFFGYSNRQDEVDQLVDQIVKNLVNQKQIVEGYQSNFKDDLDNIMATVDDRAAAAKESGNKKYTQTVIAGNHFFDGHEDSLVKTVADWLEENNSN